MDVNDVLQNISARQKEVSALADIERPLVFDIGTLTAWDPDSIVIPKAGSKREDYFRQLARDNVQVILNKLYATVDSEGTVEMPEPTTVLPRAKPVPKAKLPTKWEQFAARKGIKSNKNRDKLVWDDEANKWVPRYGFRKVQHDREKNWCTEMKD